MLSLFDWGASSTCFFSVFQPPAACFLVYSFLSYVPTWLVPLFPGSYFSRIAASFRIAAPLDLPFPDLYPSPSNRALSRNAASFRSSFGRGGLPGLGAGDAGRGEDKRESASLPALSLCNKCCLCIMKKKTCKRSCASVPALRGLPFLSGSAGSRSQGLHGRASGGNPSGPAGVVPAPAGGYR